jgi:hypothetical protein
MSMTRAQTQIDFLFAEALGVWNRALDTHCASLPYKEILAACGKRLCDRSIGIEVYEDDPSHTIARYSIGFRNGLIEPLNVPWKAEDPSWKVHRDYLEQVADNAEQYVRDPSKLEWGWLKSRVGMDD